MKFNIGTVHTSICPDRPILEKAGNAIEKAEYQAYKRGLIAYMILEQQLVPPVMKEKHKNKSLPQLQKFMVRKLLKLGYDFGEQSKEAQAFIDRQREKLGLNTPVPAPKEDTYRQTRTVTVVLERSGFSKDAAISAVESFNGVDVIEDMKADGFKVISSDYNEKEGFYEASPYFGGPNYFGGLNYFGWKKE